MSAVSFDCIVIGAGPAGYVCAVRLSQLGKSVAIVEKASTAGGTCLNVGCIPSKALLDVSHKYWQAKNDFQNIGIECSSVDLNLQRMHAHKNKIVSDLTKGIEHLFKKNKITLIRGKAEFLDNKTITVSDETNKKQILRAPHIIIATGSVPQVLETLPIDNDSVYTSTGALSFSDVPKHLVVVGGGYIGIELGSVWKRLGAQVTIVEYAETLLGNIDADVRQCLQTELEKMGMVFKLGHSVVGITKHERDFDNKNDVQNESVTPEGHICLHVQQKHAKADDAPEILMCDAVLVAAGRKPATDRLNLSAASIETDQRGFIVTNEHYETTASGIYAIGDCKVGPMLAHKAMDEGVALAELLSGQAGAVNYNIIPAVIFTHPEVAMVGKSENDLKSQDIPYKVGKFPYSANGRARSVGETIGFVKILTDPKTDRVLGCAIVGAEAGALIGQVAGVMEFGATAEDIARTCHAHPTLNEVIKEAAFAAFDKPLHS